MFFCTIAARMVGSSDSVPFAYTSFGTTPEEAELDAARQLLATMDTYDEEMDGPRENEPAPAQWREWLEENKDWVEADIAQCGPVSLGNEHGYD